MSTYWEAFEQLEDNIYSRKKVNALLRKHGNATRAKCVSIRNNYSKGICENTRSPEKMSPHASLLLYCNNEKGRTCRISSASKSLLKKFQSRKRRQWLKNTTKGFIDE